METSIDAHAPLDSIEFLIFPNQNRYEACVSYLHKKEKVSSGLLEHLLLHSAEIRELHSNGANARYGLNPPEKSCDIKWFTKSTLIRFLHIIGSANILEVANSLRNEISQLEEARRFHLSLFTKGTKSHQEESDIRYSNDIGSTTQEERSDASKNKLLRAIDSRLASLGGELTAAFDQAAGSRYSVEEMTDIEKFSRHFGSMDLSDSLHKHIELRRGAQALQNLGGNQFSQSDRNGSKEGTYSIHESVSTGTRENYDAPEGKVLQMERQSSTGSNGSSLSSEEEQRPERSCTVKRSASPRRSSSPMRRIQVGRSGSRRSTAITIKSLNCIPAREKSFLPAGAAASDSEEEGSQQAPKKSNNNVRISVQDAINLFEGKQRDHKGNIRKSGSLTTGANKAVLRRWSSGMGDNSLRSLQATSGDDTIDGSENEEIKHDFQESEAKPDVLSEDASAEPSRSDAQLKSPEKETCLLVAPEETLLTEPAVATDKLSSSAEWNRKKEAELNELMMKMMETKPMKSQNILPPSNKRHSLPSEQRGGFYDQYRERRDEKLKGDDAAGKRPEKDKLSKPTPQIPDIRKSKVASVNVSDAGRKYNVVKVQKPEKGATEPANRRAESPKPGLTKKAAPRSSSVPHTRKSWSSQSGPSPAKTPPLTSAGVTSTLRRPRSTTPVGGSNLKVETAHIQSKSVRPNWNNSKKSLGDAAERKQHSVKKSQETVKSKAQPVPESHAPAAKPSLYSKVTKKNSIVPVESKPFLRKGSGTVSNANPAVKKKAPSSPQEGLGESADLNAEEENATVSNPPDLVIHHEEKEIEETHAVTQKESSMSSPPIENDISSMVEPVLKPEDEEESIPAAAWVEIEEHDNQPATSDDHTWEMGSLSSAANRAPAVGGSSPRVRHSLSQMLLEDSEPDAPDLGNFENSWPVVEQKDSPKGLKRLLKFARKSKTDTNTGGLSSLSFLSEGEDDAENSKTVNKRNAENLLLKKATQHSKNIMAAQQNGSKFNAISLSQKFQDDHFSDNATSNKGKSFFSLSAFKGSK